MVLASSYCGPPLAPAANKSLLVDGATVNDGTEPSATESVPTADQPANAQLVKSPASALPSVGEPLPAAVKMQFGNALSQE